MKPQDLPFEVGFKIEMSCYLTPKMLGVLRDKMKGSEPLYLHCKSTGLTFKVDLVEEVTA